MEDQGLLFLRAGSGPCEEGRKHGGHSKGTAPLSEAAVLPMHPADSDTGILPFGFS